VVRLRNIMAAGNDLFIESVMNLTRDMPTITSMPCLSAAIAYHMCG
jgi:hypothetical protein